MRPAPSRALRATAALAAAAAALGLLALPAGAFRDDVELVSRAADGAPADGPSGEPSIAADGDRVAFTSSAPGLAGPDGPAADVFVRDLAAGTTLLVSRAGAAGPGGDGASGAPAISADGRHVAFESRADNLSDADVPGVSDVFVADLATGAVTLVSRAGGPAGAGGDAGSFAPAISADGRHVAFHSLAGNLSADDGHQFDVFVRDTLTGTTTLVSRADGVAGPGGNGASTAAAISADGRRVAFASDAADLAPGDHDGTDVFVRDAAAGTTTLVSRADGPAGAPGERSSRAPAISADGTRVAFESAADDLSPDDGDGADVFVRDLAAATTSLVSRASGAAGAPGDGPSSAPSISADGRHVAFASLATVLSAADDSTHQDVFLRDTLTAATILVSRGPGPAGAAADGGSREPAVAGDGTFVAFAGEADNLDPTADALVTNVFRRDVLGTPPPPPPPAMPPVMPLAPAAPPPAAGAETAAAVVRCAGVPATIVGTARRDVIRGTPGRDVVAAMGGDDLVQGLGGDDMICLGPGSDRAVGGPGDDAVLGGRGGDRVEGGAGRDLLDGGAGHDRLLGGPGGDRLVGRGGRDVAVGGPGRDICGAEVRRACELPRRSR